MTAADGPAPLIELTAELRWTSDNGGAAAGWRNRFGALAAARSFGREEASAPEGTAIYRPSDAARASPLYRVGPDRFSATVLPPYSNWAGFEPHLHNGVEMLFRAFRDADTAAPRCGEAVVRYLDAFRPAFTRGLSPAGFAAALGFAVQYPAAVARICSDPRRVATSSRLVVPLPVGEMIIAIGDGEIDGGPAVIADMAVKLTRDIAPDPAATLEALVEARSFIHEVFVDAMANFDRAIGRG